MKYFLIFNLILFSLDALAQTNTRNLGFEEKATDNEIFPWVKLGYSKKKYRVSLDSSVKHNGKYSLRFTYDTSKQGNTDGVVFNSVPFDVLGKHLRISGYFKQSNPSDTAITFSSVISGDRGEKIIAAKGVTVLNAPEWREYSYEFNLDTFKFPIHHMRINFGCKTKNTVWIDDIKVEVDGKNMFNIPSYNSVKGETISLLTTQQVTNLQVLAYVWGFLKYYHPIVAKGKFNWDMELFNQIHVVKNAPNNEQLSSILSKWIDSLGEIPECKKCPSQPGKNSFTANIDHKWMESENLSLTLRKQLKYIFKNRHTGNSFYAKAEWVRNLNFNSENEYNWREKEYPNELFRLQFLFRYWNTIQYFFPYKNLIGRDWNHVLKEYIPQFAEAKDSIEYHVAIAKLIHSVNDSHSFFYDPILVKEYALRYLPVQVSIINDQAVVYGAYNDSLAKVAGLETGDIITSINNKTIKQIIDERLPLVNGSNYQRKILSLNSYNYITGGKDSIVQLTYTRHDKSYKATVSRYMLSDFNYRSKIDKIKWKILEGNIGYVHMGNLENKEVDSMMIELRNTKAIIFDIRNYPKSTMARICEYLKRRRTEFARITYPDLSYPGNFLFKSYDIEAGPKRFAKDVFQYSGKTIMLVNESTQSHAEWTTMALQTVEGAITVGSQTSGADGNVSKLNLTGNIMTYMTGLGVFYPDGTPTQRVGVKIDVEVKPTLKGIKEKIDEVLEKALSLLN